MKPREANMRWFLFLATIVLLAAAALACGGDDESP